MLFPHVIREPANIALSRRPTAENKNNFRRNGKLTTYFRVGSYLLEAPTSDTIFADTEAEILAFKQPDRVVAVCYFKVLCENAPYYIHEYD